MTRPPASGRHELPRPRQQQPSLGTTRDPLENRTNHRRNQRHMTGGDKKLAVKYSFVFLLISFLLLFLAPSHITPIQTETVIAQQQQQQQQPPQVVANSEQQLKPQAKQAIKLTEQIRQKLFNLNEADENGIYLLGLFDVHTRAAAAPPGGGGGGGGGGRSPFACGPIDVGAADLSSRRPMQNMWAFLWAIDQVNQDDTLLPGVRLGSLVMDTCSSELQTSQQLANLLHGHHEQQLPRASQFAGVIADQRDWRSVVASASVGTSMGLATFVTQTRSSKLLSEQQQQQRQQRQQDELVGGRSGAGDVMDAPAMVRLNRQMDERLLGGLLGIGHMIPAGPVNGPEAQPTARADLSEAPPSADSGSSSSDVEELRLVKMLPGNEMIAEALASLCDQMKWDLISVIYDAAEPDLVDLHDELIRELFLRNTQLALDEPLQAPTSSNAKSASLQAPSLVQQVDEQYERILLSLAQKARFGSRAVISLLSIDSARRLQAKLNELRSGGASIKRSLANQGDTLKQLNSIQWITVTDREPYYSYPTDSLGVISASSSSSLMPEFKHYYDHLRLIDGNQQLPNATTTATATTTTDDGASDELRQPNNKWWPEFMRAVMMRRREQLGELLADECAKWLEPKSSPLNKKCRELNLASLADLERSKMSPPRGGSQRTATTGSGQQQFTRDAPLRLVPTINSRLANDRRAPDGSNKLSRYLASGWDHNGMDVINSVLAIANGLESLRQTMCSNATVGLCPEMRQLLKPSHNEGSTGDSQDAEDSSGELSPRAPSISELVHEELTKLTFQMVDGQMFRLNQSPSGGAGPSSSSPAAALAAAAGGGGGGRDDLTLGLLASGFLPPTPSQQDPIKGASQLQCRLKFYNLRFLRPNSIGFVKFAQFSQEDGLTWQANQSQALHYASIPSNFSDQLPISEIKSTCLDETKCLMLSAMSVAQPVAGKSSGPVGAKFSEEQLAANFNSLFKLDHPLISAGGLAAAAATATNQDETNPAAAIRTQNELAGVRTMRSRAKYLSVPLTDPFQPPETPAPTTSDQTGQTQQKRRLFEVIVLLPLHKSSLLSLEANKTTSTTTTAHDTTIQSSSCGSVFSSSGNHFQLDEAHSFQQLAALAYAQQLVNGHLQLPRGEAANHQLNDALTTMALNSNSTSAQAASSGGGGGGGIASRQLARQVGNELVISVIDYCGQMDLAEETLSALLRSRRQVAVSAAGAGAAAARQSTAARDDQQLVAVVDFDARVAKRSERALSVSGANLLHLTIAHRHSPTSSTDRPSTGDIPTMGDDAQASHALRVNLLPSKAKEIEALLSLVRSFPSWRMVHLIYTDAHGYREEFVRRANEAGICVSKLIWIPQVVLDENDEDAQGSGKGKNEDRLGRMLEKTKQLFERELYDFSQQQQQQQQQPQPQPPGYKNRASAEPGLNSTRLLVVLASANDATNRLILEAASQSMLDDYVWLTSHEWLRSIELPFERAATAETANNKPDTAARFAQALPKHFLSTKMESFESRHFREYFNHLLPALHEPIPADWFDEFWQQHFQCKLPTSLAGGGDGRFGMPASSAIRQEDMARIDCNYSQRLNWEQMRQEDDLVPYTIRAIEALQVALSADTTGKDEKTRLQELARDFRLAFDMGTREVVGNLDGPSQSAKSKRRRPVEPQSLIGFHIVHRLRPDGQAANQQDVMGPNRRMVNSRQMDDSPLGRLVRVGLWRDHYQLKHGVKLVLSPFGKRRQKGAATQTGSRGASEEPRREQDETRELLNDRGSVMTVLESFATDGSTTLKQESDKDAAPDRESELVARSLDRLADIKSRCNSRNACGACRQQISLTMSLIQQEEARLGLGGGGDEDEPVAISGGSLLSRDNKTNGSSSVLDLPALTNFDDELEDEDVAPTSGTEFATNHRQALKADRRLQDEIQASASSLFDARTSQEVAGETRRAYRHYANHHHHHQTSSPFWPFAAADLRRHSGVLLSMLSLIGVAFAAITMTHFYPNMLNSQAAERAAAAAAGADGPHHWVGNRVKKFNQSQRSTSSSQCNIMLANADDDDELTNRMLAQRRPGSLVAAIMDNIADYLILSALLMLYSINVAFLMPAASVGVCWLRRIGLSLSYTLLFGAILAKIRETSRRQRWLESCEQVQEFAGGRRHSSVAVANQMVANQTVANQRSTLKPLDESVEVTFESLTNDCGGGCSRVEEAPAMHEDGGQTHVAQEEHHHHHHHHHHGADCLPSQAVPDSPQAITLQQPADGSLKLPLILSLLQLTLSVVWLSHQQPEPTLHQHTCWHCVSATKSPILFLYEPLPSLAAPALVLAFAWLWSVILFNRISTNERHFVGAMRRLIMDQPLSFSQMQNPDYVRLKQKQMELSDQLRESKLLVTTTTLLVLVWASATLGIVTSSRQVHAQTLTPASTMSAATYRQHLGIRHGLNTDGQTAVYMNLLSGLVVFMVLFVFRLNWLFGCVSAAKARKFNYDQICPMAASPAGSRSGPRLKPFRLFRNRRGSGSLATGAPDHRKRGQATGEIDDELQSANGDRLATAAGRQERLKLQHFSMTYGTYSAGSTSRGVAGDEAISLSDPMAVRQRDGLSIDVRATVDGKVSRMGSKNSSSSSKSRSIFKLRKSALQSPTKTTNANTTATTTKNTVAKLQRRQSNGSAASSQANLMRHISELESTDDDDANDDFGALGEHQLDTISCAMSVASNSTSQLQGNELYPIDCSIQLESAAQTAQAFQQQPQQSASVEPSPTNVDTPRRGRPQLTTVDF